MTPVDTPQVTDHTAEPQSELWTSDSERGQSATDALPSGAEEVDADKPTPDPVANAAPDASLERDDTGKFKPRGKGKPRNDPQARVEAATAKEAAAKEEARQIREENARLKTELETRSTASPRVTSPPTTTAGVSATFPAFDAWSEANPGKEYDDYVDARADWRYDLKRQQDGERLQQETYQTRMAEGTAKLTDFQSVTQAAEPVISAGLKAHGMDDFPTVIHRAVATSAIPAEIIRFLALHPEDAIQLAVESKDSPVSAAPVMRRYLESQVSAGAATPPDSAPTLVRPSAAKAPVNRVGGTATATPVDPEDLEFGPDYIRQENERERKARAAGRW